MFETVRGALHWAITTELGDSLWAIRTPKSVARRIHTMLGEPLRPAPRAEGPGAAATTAPPVPARSVEPPAPVRRAAAPVMVYHEKDRNARELARIREVLEAREIPHRVLDVTGDEATLSFVTREARCEADQLPVVFVAGEVIGTFADVVQADVAGDLVRAVFGASA